MPTLLSTLIVADDALLAAEISCVLAKRGAYLPIIEAPRMQRMDAEAEVLRCNNTAARMQPKTIVFAGVELDIVAALGSHFPKKRTHVVNSIGEVPETGHSRRAEETLIWGRENIGLGLLRALRERRRIVFAEGAASPTTPVEPEPGGTHLVVYEEDTDLGAVIAANFAFATGAGLVRIPKIPDERREQILEAFYGVYDDRDRPPADTLRALESELKGLAGGLSVQGRELVTFITRDLPWGFAFPECPSSHLFSYPDLGKSVLVGVLAEQPKVPGIRVALLVDPAEEQSKDIEFAIASLKHRGAYVRVLGGKGASVYRVSRTLELFPYDFLMISTHCGDAPGWRWTYEFTDRDRRSRTLVVDVAISVTAVPGEEKLEVLQFDRFVSLDGVDWHDPDKSAKLVVGNAILDYLELVRAPEKLMPVKKEPIKRVIGSAALQLANGNYLAKPVSYAAECTPIVLNNACSSWHSLAGMFTFGNARAYIGTLFPVTEFEALEIGDRLLKRHFGKPLAVALWHAQNEVFGAGGVRRPYALVGVHFQRLRTTHVDAPRHILGSLQRTLRSFTRRTAIEADASEGGARRSTKDFRRWLSEEIRHIRERWIR